jgi:hypothetical protein
LALALQELGARESRRRDLATPVTARPTAQMAPWRSLDALRDWSAGFGGALSEEQLAALLQDAYTQQPVLTGRWFEGLTPQWQSGRGDLEMAQVVAPPAVPSRHASHADQHSDFSLLAKTALSARSGNVDGDIRRAATTSPERADSPTPDDQAVAALRNFASRRPGLLRGALLGWHTQTGLWSAQAAALLADVLLGPSARWSVSEDSTSARALIDELMAQQGSLDVTEAQWRALLNDAAQALPATTGERLNLIRQVVCRQNDHEPARDAARDEPPDDAQLRRAAAASVLDRAPSRAE